MLNQLGLQLATHVLCVVYTLDVVEVVAQRKREKKRKGKRPP